MKTFVSIAIIVTGLGMSPALAGPSTAESEAPLPGAAYPMAEQGADLAQMWCNACHVTGTGKTESAMDAAPPFSKLSPLVIANPEHYRAFLTRPHGPMKEITLSRDEIEALLTYISSLQAPPEAE
jgi:mono/diheme cytochrome c family protein